MSDFALLVWILNFEPNLNTCIFVSGIIGFVSAMWKNPIHILFR